MAIYCLFIYYITSKHLLRIHQLYARLPLLYSISLTVYVFVFYIQEYVKECSGNVRVYIPIEVNNTKPSDVLTENTSYIYMTGTHDRNKLF